MRLQPGLARRLFNSLMQTFRFWMRTEIHVYSFSVAANVLLSFFPFLIVTLSLSRIFFNQYTTTAAIDLALRDYFPDALGQFLKNNLPPRQPPQVVSILLLLFTANGIFEPLEVALNHIWGIHKNRSFLRNQVVSLALIFGCGSLALFSLWLMAIEQSGQGSQVEKWVSALLFKTASVPMMALILFLVYRFLPNGKPPLSRIVPAAIGVGLLLEVLKWLNTIFWPRFDLKIAREYGVFRYSVTLIFLGFLCSMLFLAGAEWAARGNRMDRPELKKLEPEH
jgi:YihY family inner membrane protein